MSWNFTHPSACTKLHGRNGEKDWSRGGGDAYC